MTADYTQNCHVGAQASDFEWELAHSKPHLLLEIFAGFKILFWQKVNACSVIGLLYEFRGCAKETAVSHSGAEAEIISPDAGGVACSKLVGVGCCRLRAFQRDGQPSGKVMFILSDPLTVVCYPIILSVSFIPSTMCHKTLLHPTTEFICSCLKTTRLWSRWSFKTEAQTSVTSSEHNV